MGWVLLALAALGTILILRYLAHEFNFLKLPQTTATMVSCEPLLARTERAGSRPSVPYWTVAARFTFSVNGVGVEGTHLSNLAPKSIADNWHLADAPPESIVALCRRYSSGTKVQVHYSPSDPRTSFVYFTSPLRDWPWAIAPILAGFIGWVFLFAGRLAAK
jgi:hypothetical protein